MRIGIDLDGVVYDSEKDLRIYTELYDTFELKQNNLVNTKEVKIMKRFNWNEEQFAGFLNKYHLPIVKTSNYMPGAQMILKKLKEEGHELIVITARGGYNKEIITATEKRFKDDNMDIFDECYYNCSNKGEICKKANIDLMIDDSNENCEDTSRMQVKTIYLKDAPSYDMEENEYLKVLYNWGEIYKYIKQMEN